MYQPGSTSGSIKPPYLLFCDVGTIRRLYLQHLIAKTPQNRLRAVLAPLAAPEGGKKLQVDVNYLVEHPDEIVPYFTSKAADDVLLTIGSMLAQNGEKVDVRHLTNAQQQQLKTAMDNGQLSDWVAKKYRNGRSDPDEVSLWPTYRAGMYLKNAV